MLSIRRLATSSDALRSYGASKPVPAAKKSLQRTVMKKYSTVRRRVVNASSSSKPSSYATEDALMTEKTKQELDREFDETFFRKPKVLIIGTDVAAMTAALTLQSYNIKPDILDTGHYMHPLAPTKVRAQIVPMSSMRVFESLGITRHIEAIGTPLTIYGRADRDGGALASLNFSSLRTYQDRPTLGVNYLELERTLQELVAVKSPIRPQCMVQAIESLPAPDNRMAHVKWLSNYMTSQTPEKGLYDCVIVSEGTFSMSRELHWPNGYTLEGAAQYYEAVIPRPANVMKGYASDQWGNDRRVGFFPVGGANRDQLYVFAQVRLPEHGGPTPRGAASTEEQQAGSASAPPKQERVPATAMLECFTEFGGPWKDVAESIAALPSVNRTVVLTGNMAGEHAPVKGRVVVIGNSGLTLPGPCLGHDLGIATDSAQFVANAVSFATTPLLAGIYAFNKQYNVFGPLVEAIRSDIRTAVLYTSRLPQFISKWFFSSAFSDKGLVSQQIEFLGLKMSKEEQIDAFPIKRIQQLRHEWHQLPESEREAAKKQLSDSLRDAEAKMERDLAELAIQQQKQKPTEKQ